jgi:hypothetical protein
MNVRNSLKPHLLVIGCIILGLCSAAWAAHLPFGQVVTGTISRPAEVKRYTFSANANDVFDFTMTTTSGTLSPKIQLYTSAGVLLASANNYECRGSFIELDAVPIPTTGMYDLLVSDCSDTLTGNYALYSQRTNNPSGAMNLQFGHTDAGTITSAAQSNTYTFSANAADVMDFTLTATNGMLSPKILLYNPSGTLLTSANNYECRGSTIELNIVQIPTTGKYTVLVRDCFDTFTGNYALYSQRTNDPSRPVPLRFGHTQSGEITSAAESKTYTFNGSASDVVDFTLTTTSGSLSPKVRLYNPDGTLLASANNYECRGSTIQMDSPNLPSSGTYTVLVGDCSDTLTGNYNLSSQCFGTCADKMTLATTIVPSVNPSGVGQTVTFTATVTTSSTTIPTGVVQFMDGDKLLGTRILGSGEALYSTSTLSAGSHNITAVYQGTLSITGSTSEVLVQTVN